MTIKYRIFGKPGNLDEFVDKAKKEGYGRIDVLAGVYEDSDSELAIKLRLSLIPDVSALENKVYCSIIRLNAGDKTFQHSKKSFELSDAENPALRAAMNFKKLHQYLYDAVEAAEEVSSKGLEATINGEPVDLAKEMIVQYRKKVDDLFSQYHPAKSRIIR